MSNVKVIIADKKHDMSHMMGQFPTEADYDLLIEEDCDVYMPAIYGEDPINENRIVLKFRKNYFSKEQQDQALAGLRDAATETQNRGLAAGPRKGSLGNRQWVTEYEYDIIEYFLNPVDNLFGEDPIDEIKKRHVTTKSNPSNRNNVWSIERTKECNFNFEEWVEKTRHLSKEEQIKQGNFVADELVCLTTYANSVNSGIAGWFDRYPRIPYGRATSYTARYPDKFAKAFPFLQSLAKGFKDLLPTRFNAQMNAASKIDPAFLIPETPFTTVTVNKSFRTACHFDAGDFTEGLSNLLTLSNTGNYRGCYLVAPEYRIAVNPRPGDLLLINNHEVMHGNTQIEIDDDVSERISLVVYLREKMLELGSKQYEDTRYQFVEDRRLNKEHPMQRKLWNGVSEGMWLSDEWYDYLRCKMGQDAVNKYHPNSIKSSTLDDFFG